MGRNPGKIIDANNPDVLNAIRNGASLDYQRRIPAATQANVSELLGTLTRYRPLYNEFCDALINRIALVIARNNIWNNPLAVFKRGNIVYGSQIEEIQTGLIEAREYSPGRDYLEKEIFGQHRLDVRSAFHTVDRQNYYPVTVNEPILRRAFLEAGGLSVFVSKIMAAPTTSDQWDEFLLMTSLFKAMDSGSGIFRVKCPNMQTLSATAADARSALKVLRATAGRLGFLSTNYNPAGMPTFASPDELVIFASPEFVANIDVEALAAAFNMDRSDAPSRIIQVPQESFGIDECQAILTTTDFFVVADTLIETRSQPNPVGLTTNYFLHHHEIISASRFAPAVMLTTGTATVIPTAPKAPVLGAVTVKRLDGGDVPATGAVPGETLVVSAPVTGGDGFEWGIDFEVTGGLSSRTRIDNEGVLVISPSERSGTLTITASLAYRPAATPQAAPVQKTGSVKVEIAKAIKE